MYFYAIDGDDVGRTLEYFILSNDCEAVKQYSKQVNSAIDALANGYKGLGCRLVFLGGDSILASSESPIENKKLPISKGQLTFSVGVGTTPARALVALKLAKGKGKNRVEVFRIDEI